MTITFVSNYINHHQIPLCEELFAALGMNFTFIQTEEMEEERIKMGWNPEDAGLQYVLLMYEEHAAAEAKILDADVVLAGWAPRAEEIISKRLAQGKLTFRISERLYKDGQWKAISPRGQLAKRRQFTRFKDKPYYLLCAGAYVGSDYSLFGAFPNKKLKWGYFPPVRCVEMSSLHAKKNEVEAAGTLSGRKGTLEMIWAGRFVDFKHVEVCIRLVTDLAAAGYDFHMNIVGDGDQMEACRAEIRKNRCRDFITFHGFREPEDVRDLMEQCSVMVFTSDHGEGWGAVVNEAMNAGCAIIAGSEAGAVPYLVRNGLNGYIYNGMNYPDLYAKVCHVLEDRQQQERFGAASLRAIRETWNAKVAAARLLRVCEELLQGKRLEQIELPADGPMSLDMEMKPFLQVPTLENRSSIL